MKTQIKKLVAVVLVMASACAVCAQETEQDHIKEIFSLAKKSAEEDFNIEFYGFFAGMSRYDAADLAEYYKLNENEFSVSVGPGKAVTSLWFSLKGIRRITRGGNTLDELAQAVMKRVGNMRRSGKNGEYEHRTIDGVVVTMDNNGLTIRDDKVASRRPIVTKKNAQKEGAVIQSISGNMVAIPGKRFKMGKYEVTQRQWQEIMGNNPSCFKNPDSPVESVSWDSCKDFIRKLNSMPEVRASGLTFRLPTEAEWEYACLAGGMGEYCRLADGTEITADTIGKVSWYGGNSEGTTHPVGQKLPNAFGLYDMHGNALEWCEDQVSSDDTKRVCRGGSWSDFPGGCTVSCRFSLEPGNWGRFYGFRLAASE